MQQKHQALRSLCETVDQMLLSLRWPPERSARVWVSHSTTLKICLDASREGIWPLSPLVWALKPQRQGLQGGLLLVCKGGRAVRDILMHPEQTCSSPCSISTPPLGFVGCFFHSNDFCRSSCGNLKGSWSQNSDTLPSSTLLLHVQITEGEPLNFQARHKNRPCWADPRLSCPALV